MQAFFGNSSISSGVAFADTAGPKVLPTWRAPGDVAVLPLKNNDGIGAPLRSIVPANTCGQQLQEQAAPIYSDYLTTQQVHGLYAQHVQRPWLSDTEFAALFTSWSGVALSPAGLNWWRRWAVAQQLQAAQHWRHQQMRAGQVQAETLQQLSLAPPLPLSQSMMIESRRFFPVPSKLEDKGIVTNYLVQHFVPHQIKLLDLVYQSTGQSRGKAMKSEKILFFKWPRLRAMTDACWTVLLGLDCRESLGVIDHYGLLLDQRNLTYNSEWRIADTARRLHQQLVQSYRKEFLVPGDVLVVQEDRVVARFRQAFELSTAANVVTIFQDSILVLLVTNNITPMPNLLARFWLTVKREVAKSRAQYAQDSGCVREPPRHATVHQVLAGASFSTMLQEEYATVFPQLSSALH